MKNIFSGLINDVKTSTDAEGTLLYPAALIFVIFFVPLSDGGTTHFPWVINRLVIFSAVTIALWKEFGRGEIRVAKSGFNVCWVILAILLLVEVFRAGYTYMATQWLVSYAAMAGLFFIAAHVGKNDKRASWIENAYVISGVFESLLAIGQYFFDESSRARGTFFNPSFFGGYVGAVATIPFAKAIFTPKGEFLKKRNLFNLSAFIVMCMGVLVSGSRGGLAALVGGMAIAGYMRFGVKTAPVILAFLIAIIVIPNPLQRRLKNLTSQDPYAWSRIQIWQSSLSMIKDHPLGVGPGMFNFYSQKYAFPVPTYARYGKVAEKAHGSYFDFATELSPLGAVLIIGMGIYIVFYGMKNASKNKSVTSALWSAPVAAVMTHGVFDSAHTTPPSALLGAMAAGMIWSLRSSNLPILNFKVRTGFKWAALLLGSVFIIKSATIYAAYYASRKAETVGDERAEKWLKLTNALEPTNASYWYNRGTWEKAMWQNEKGAEHLSNACGYMEDAMKLNPVEDRFPSAYANLLNIAAPSGAEGDRMLQKAVDMYKVALNIAPKNPFYHEREGEILAKLGRKKEAMVEFQIALDLEPNYLHARRELAKLMEQDGNISDAAAQYDILLEKIKSIPKKFTSDYERELARDNVDQIKKEAIKIRKMANKPDGFTITR